MKVRIFIMISVLFVSAFAAQAMEAKENADANKPLTDVNIIINKANIVAYYLAADGKARVNMKIMIGTGT